ncbi:MAG: hypothetical protein K8S62_13040 [Candidatus Sabulitectum sp.]|nr:hypothetical protein [Candidatus Sabulitectum sp.]
MYRVTVDADKKAVLSAVDIAAAEFGISWFLCGAYSRILLCEEVLKTPAGRATYDLDIAICVRSLNEYARFRDTLCQEYMFEPDSKKEHRLKHRSSGILTDIIPFGKFAEPDELYNWGADDAFEMNVRGFDDAFSSAISFLLNNELVVKSAGYAEQFVLKLFAWQDRRSTRGIDDAADLAYFLNYALKSISETDLYSKYDSVLKETEYDIKLASCFALGRQIRSVFSRRTVRRIIEILGSELEAREDSALISDMYDRFSSWQQPDERISKVIGLVLKGLS